MKKEGWPEFPFFWIEKPDMSSLQVLASHLKEKSETLRDSYGFHGETSPVEKQIIERLTVLQQQTLVLTDVVQASLQVIDDQRISQRIKRALRWIREKASEYGHRLWDSTIFKILGAVSTLSFIVGIVIYVLRHLRK